MPRRGIEQEDVLAVIEKMLEQGVMPTAQKVRAHLGTGSLSTVQKHFKAWKTSAYQANTQPVSDETDVDEGEVASSVAFNETLAKQEENIKMLSKSLMEKEKDCLALTEENQQLNDNLSQMTTQCKNLRLEKKAAADWIETLEAERETYTDKLMAAKDAEIRKLKGEIKETNAQYLTAIREKGAKGSDNLVQEKVKVVNLEEKNKQLHLTIQSLEEKLERAKAIVQPLKKQLNEQEEIIQKYVTWEDLQQHHKSHQDE